jgi:hypothetical protein
LWESRIDSGGDGSVVAGDKRMWRDDLCAYRCRCRLRIEWHRLRKSGTRCDGHGEWRCETERTSAELAFRVVEVTMCAIAARPKLTEASRRCELAVRGGIDLDVMTAIAHLWRLFLERCFLDKLALRTRGIQRKTIHK